MEYQCSGLFATLQAFISLEPTTWCIYTPFLVNFIVSFISKDKIIGLIRLKIWVVLTRLNKKFYDSKIGFLRYSPKPPFVESLIYLPLELQNFPPTCLIKAFCSFAFLSSYLLFLKVKDI